MNGAAYAILGAWITVSAGLSCGMIVFQRLGIALRRIEHHLLAFVAGSAILSVVILGLAAAQQARKSVFVALAAALMAFAYRHRRGVACEPLAMPGSRWLPVLFSAIATPFAGLYLVTAWAPEVSPDGSSYHLGNVLRFSAHHGLIPIRDMYGALPEGLEMLFLSAFSIGRHPAAALVHLSFLIALPLLVISYSLRFGMPRAGFLAGTLVFLSPVIGQDGSVAYNDVALATAAFAVVYIVELWLDQGQAALLIIAGLLAGFCFGIKYTGFVAAVYVLSQIGVRAIQDRSLQWRTVLLFAVPCLAIAGPWVVKNWVYLGNPVAPFFNHIFPNPYVSAQFERDYSESMAHYAGTRDIRDLAFKYTMTGSGVVGFLGPLFLLAPLGMIALGSERGRRLLLAALFFGLPVVANGGTRFLIPAVPCIAVTIGMAVADTRFAVPFLMLLQALASWPAVERKYCDHWAWYLHQLPLRAIFDDKAAQSYLHTNLGPSWDMARILDREAPLGSRTFCFSCPAQAYSLQNVSGYYETTESRALWDMLWTPMERERQPRKRVTVTFPAIVSRRIRVTLPQARPDQVWSVAEMRLLKDAQEVPRSPNWRIHAAPDPWEAPFAFDRSPVSRWSAERYGATGAFLEVTFDRPIAVDSVILDCPEDAPEKIGVRAEVAPGRTIAIHADIHAIAVDPPAGMRRGAIQMLESYGFRYLIVSDNDYYANDYKKYPDFWGVHSIAEAGNWTLYHLD